MRLGISTNTPLIEAIKTRLEQGIVQESGKVVRPLPAAGMELACVLTDEYLDPQIEQVLVLSAWPLPVQGEQRLLFGVREWTPEDVARWRGRSYDMREIAREGLLEVTDAIMSRVREWDAFHLVVDLSVVDPAFAPGVESPVAGGLTSRELLWALQRFRLLKNLHSAQVIVDARDEPITRALAVKIVGELL